MKQFKFSIHGNQYTVDVHGIEDNQAHLEVNGTAYDVEIHRKSKASKTPTLVRPAPKATPTPDINRKEGGSSHGIPAPLPGKVLKLHVSKGDIVEKGQLLLVMEAMKMENKVLSDRAGVVEKILVDSGDAVLQGDVLLEIV
jgi:biotin carboxyl carrier protein